MEEEKNSMLFNSLVYSFSMQTMIQLGKLKNPVTNETDRDLEAAKVTIDMLDMLKEKTKNNLGEEETKFLDQTISELKLNFVDEKNKVDGQEAKPITEDTSNNGTEENDAPKDAGDEKDEKDENEKSEGDKNEDAKDENGK